MTYRFIWLLRCSLEDHKLVRRPRRLHDGVQDDGYVLPGYEGFPWNDSGFEARRSWKSQDKKSQSFWLPKRKFRTCISNEIQNGIGSLSPLAKLSFSPKSNKKGGNWILRGECYNCNLYVQCTMYNCIVSTGKSRSREGGGQHRLPSSHTNTSKHKFIAWTRFYRHKFRLGNRSAKSRSHNMPRE